MLDKLWKDRLSQNLRQKSKQLSYVFNDHFSLVLVFLIGLGSYSYAQWLTQVQVLDDRLVAALLSLLFALVTPFFKIASHVQEADAHFLSHLDRQWRSYLIKASCYSTLLPLLSFGLLTLLALPLLAKTHLDFNLLWFLTILSCLGLEFTANYRHFYAVRLLQLPLRLALYLILYGLYFVNSLFSLLALVVTATYFAYTHKCQGLLDWQVLQDAELARVNRQNSVLRLFIDLPALEKPAKKHPFLEKILLKGEDASAYLFQRQLLRDGETINLVVRLTVLLALFSAVVDNIYLYNALCLAVLLLIVLQISPNYKNLRHFGLYAYLPIPKGQAKAAFLAFLIRLGYLPLLVLSLLAFWKFSLVEAVGTIILQICLNNGLIPLYVAKKIDKISR